MQFFWRAQLYRARMTWRPAAASAARLAEVAGTDQAITAHFSDGTRDSVGIPISVDGIRSTIRALIDPAAPQSCYTSLLNLGARAKAPDWPPPAMRRAWSWLDHRPVQPAAATLRASGRITECIRYCSTTT
jgi:hypothetical protein